MNFSKHSHASLASRQGSATMEYTLVSTFAVLLSIASLTYVGRMIRTKVDAFAKKSGIPATELSIPELNLASDEP